MKRWEYAEAEVPMDPQRAQALVAEALARATGAVVAPDDVVVDRETPGMVFVGVPGHGQFAGVDLDGATRSRCRSSSGGWPAATRAPRRERR